MNKLRAVYQDSLAPFPGETSSSSSAGKITSGVDPPPQFKGKVKFVQITVFFFIKSESGGCLWTGFCKGDDKEMLPPLKQRESGNNCLSDSCCKLSYFCNPLKDFFVLEDLFSQLTVFEILEPIDTMELTKTMAEWKNCTGGFLISKK